jgi:hypothetical protein
MRRKTFDALVSTAGLVVAAVLLVASGLLFWANSFIDDNVNSQLSEQKIFMPKAGSEQLNDPRVKPYLEKYAGQQVVDGAQARAFADHYIKVHLNESTGGKTYSELSTLSRQSPTDEKLAGQVQTAFRGETLRGMLLSAYAFWQMGQVAFIAAWVALGTGLSMLFLSVLGLVHLRRTEYDVKVHVPGWHPENVSTS